MGGRDRGKGGGGWFKAAVQGGVLSHMCPRPPAKLAPLRPAHCPLMHTRAPLSCTHTALPRTHTALPCAHLESRDVGLHAVHSLSQAKVSHLGDAAAPAGVALEQNVARLEVAVQNLRPEHSTAQHNDSTPSDTRTLSAVRQADTCRPAKLCWVSLVCSTQVVCAAGKPTSAGLQGRCQWTATEVYMRHRERRHTWFLCRCSMARAMSAAVSKMAA